MKIAVSSTGTTLYDFVAHSFGRCPNFLIVDPVTFEYEDIKNPNASLLGGGAGVKTSGLLAKKGVSVILTGKCGPDAIQVFGEKGIKIIQNIRGPIKQAVQTYYSDVIKNISPAQVAFRFIKRSGGEIPLL